MTRLKLFFAVVLLLLAVPFWRYLDMAVILWPQPLLLSFFQSFWAFLFLLLPLKLLRPSVKPLYLIGSLITLSIIFWFSGPLSNMATTGPEFNHCGRLTYTGFVYPARSLFTEAHMDDLDARNQLCWLRKMILRLPTRFDDEKDYQNFETLLQQKLLKPEYKYRVALPLIAVLYGSMGMTLGEIKGGFTFVKSLQFWRTQYTVEIAQRQYNPWNWPHSSYIQFEYGLVEKNWEKIIDSVVIEIN